MGTPKIVEDSGKPEMKPIFNLDMSHLIDEGRVQLHKGGREIKETPEMIWELISPEMIPMPGTPDFCEFCMDGVV